MLIRKLPFYAKNSFTNINLSVAGIVQYPVVDWCDFWCVYFTLYSCLRITNRSTVVCTVRTPGFQCDCVIVCHHRWWKTEDSVPPFSAGQIHPRATFNINKEACDFTTFPSRTITHASKKNHPTPDSTFEFGSSNPFFQEKEKEKTYFSLSMDQSYPA